MPRPIRALPFAALFLLAAGSPLAAQVLHTNDRWDECALVIDPLLTQEAWHQFASEVGLVTYFRPLVSARPLGRKHIELAILQSATRIDDGDDAWNDTFSHPDSAHWLFEGSVLAIPGLSLRAGVTDRLDVAAYFTKSIGANYGFLGGQVQYSLVNDPVRKVAAAGRVSYTNVFGPEDLGASVYGVDFLVSKDIGMLSPYAGVSGYLSRAAEHTSKVDLENEDVVGVQSMVGVAVSLKALRLGAEYNFARVNGYAFKIAFGT